MTRYEEFIRRNYEAFNTRDFAPLVDLVTEDFVYDDTRRMMDGTVSRGRDAAREHWEQMHEPWQGLQVDLEEVIDAGPGVAVSVARVSARGPASGADVRARVAHVWRFRDGKLAHLEYFGDREQALAAARAEVA